MKLNVTVEIDWIDEEGNLDDEVQGAITNGIIERISNKCIQKIEQKANEQINLSLGEAQKLIEDKAMAFVENWLNNEVSVTDKWGDVVETCSISELIKKSFDNLLQKKVDKDGHFNSSSYGNTRLIDWLTGQKVQSIVEEKLKDMSRTIDKSIEAAVRSGIKQNVSNKFAEMVVQTAKEQNLLPKT